MAHEALLEEVRKRFEESRKENDEFLERHVFSAKDELAMVLKVHLYLESNLDRLLSLLFPNPTSLLKAKFSEKLKIIEATGLLQDSTVIEKISIINKLRNKFAHDLTYQLTNEDVEPLMRDLEEKDNRSIVRFFKAVGFVHGYLDTARAMIEIFPYFMLTLNNKSLFEKDPVFNWDSLAESYKKKGLMEVMESYSKNLAEYNKKKKNSQSSDLEGALDSI